MLKTGMEWNSSELKRNEKISLSGSKSRYSFLLTAESSTACLYTYFCPGAVAGENSRGSQITIGYRLGYCIRMFKAYFRLDFVKKERGCAHPLPTPLILYLLEQHGTSMFHFPLGRHVICWLYLGFTW